MDNKKRIKYERIAKITGIVIGLILVFGISYAVFKTVTKSEETNTISAGKLDVRVENEKDEIMLENSYPITEEEGLKQSPYTFDIVNEGTLPAMYDLYIELTKETTLPENTIRYYLTRVEGTEEVPIDNETSHLLTDAIEGEKEGTKLYRIDTNDLLEVKEKVSYKLYLWIDYETTKEEATNKKFEGRIRIETSQVIERKEELIRKVDVSEEKNGTVYAYMYADKTVILKGKGKIATGLSDMLVYDNSDLSILNNWKKTLIQAGCDKKEVNAITTYEELEEYIYNFTEEEWNNYYVAMYKEIFTEMGYDTNSFTDMESTEIWFIEQGFLDEEGNTTEEGEIVLEEFNSRYIEKYDYSNVTMGMTPAKKIIIEEGITNIPEGLYTGNEDITEVSIPTSITSIDDKAFYGCSNLMKIYFPASINNVLEILGNCPETVEFEIDRNSKYYTTIDGFIYNKEETELLYYPLKEDYSEVNVPSTVTKVRIFSTKQGNVFDYIENINELIIDVEGIIKCDSSGSAPWYGIREQITKVTFTDAVTGIGSYAFEGFSNVSVVRMTGNTAFGYLTSYFPNFKTVYLYGAYPVGRGGGSGSMFSGAENIIIEEGVTGIVSGAFRGGAGGKTITIPSSVVNVESSAFDLWGWYTTQTINIDNTEEFVNSHWDSRWKNNCYAQINYLK